MTPLDAKPFVLLCGDRCAALPHPGADAGMAAMPSALPKAHGARLLFPASQTKSGSAAWKRRRHRAAGKVQQPGTSCLFGNKVPRPLSTAIPHGAAHWRVCPCLPASCLHPAGIPPASRRHPTGILPASIPPASHSPATQATQP